MISHTIRLAGLLLVLAGCTGTPAPVVDRTVGEVAASPQDVSAAEAAGASSAAPAGEEVIDEQESTEQQGAAQQGAEQNGAEQQAAEQTDAAQEDTRPQSAAQVSPEPQRAVKPDAGQESPAEESPEPQNAEQTDAGQVSPEPLRTNRPDTVQEGPEPLRAEHPDTVQESAEQPSAGQPESVVQQSAAPERAVALLLPLGDERPMEAARALALRNAAEMAVDDLAPGTLRLRVYDTSTGAALAAEQAIADGAELLLGPMFAAAVREVSESARLAGIRCIAFSTDASVAGGAVYLIGSLPDAEFLRVLRYAARSGHQRIAALVPDTRYGAVAADALNRVTFAADAPLRSSSVLRYSPEFESARIAAEQFAATRARRIERSPGTEVSAVLMADSGQNLETLVGFLDSAGVTAPDIRLLGSGVWDNAAVARDELLRGAWFAVPDPHLRSAFAARYSGRHGSGPPALAALAYDAVAIAGVLALSGGPDPFSDQAIQDRAGFAGVTGLVRFGPDGLNERSLAVLEVTNDGFRVIDPAPRSFPGES